MRTAIGELVYRLKNAGDTSVIPEIVEFANSLKGHCSNQLVKTTRA
jgi:hypothetical protein